MNSETRQRLRLEIVGLVQGVGFRPFVYRLAVDCGLSGWVANGSAGVCVEVEGESTDLRRFQLRLPLAKPALAQIESVACTPIPLQRDCSFRVRASETGTAAVPVLPPDLAPCDDCLREMSNPGNRRFKYPFINCTQCGPRFSIVERLPYDRDHTAMKHFPLCAACKSEYDDPADRRFHAEPIACPECGPQLKLQDSSGNTLAAGDQALQLAALALSDGQIVALKGVGGFQLLVDAGNTIAVKQLRTRKRRPQKPFALMYPDLTQLKKDCVTSVQEEACLIASQRPILLLKAKPGAGTRISSAVSPANPNLGVMLPSAPLHHLLLESIQRPLVATSGNLSGEPICIDNDEVVHRLGQIADLFLVHDREILRPLDDSVVRVMDGQTVLLRRARGYAPLPLPLPEASCSNRALLALGADLKNCVATSLGNTAYLSPHIGDLQDHRTLQQFEHAVADLIHLHNEAPTTLLCDRHPGYESSRWARKQWADMRGETPRKPLEVRPHIEVQHHIAHLFSCMAEHQFRGAALGICWDGTGLGEDGSLRGSDCLYWNGRGAVTRIGSLREFPLPGGEQAIREPRRTLAGLLYECLGERAFSCNILMKLFTVSELSVIRTMLERGINSPRCSSVGRMFDAVAVILGLVDSVSFEGQAAMAVEFAAGEFGTDAHYHFNIDDTTQATCSLDWAPIIMSLLEDMDRGISSACRAAAFHNTLAQMALATALRANVRDVFLSGGVFQNKRLVERTAELLRLNGFQVYSHRQVPPNDGGIALGQLYYARCMDDCLMVSEEGSALCV
ncbi:carbamoyltransferase HypF [Microbulbifer bruguierae]|uniref:Carbamoyltransferase HypF n=1 Tax=Microbulbifer bruguierae TaxID=3029061 RepID=A0ABY8NDV3_9GAMM|nr:carbamoyltransferase HypF [Microbulbifer bruguierae]WGL17100.1 carbamoyltransferase HypF [Microbulbifer bruguierae]